MTGRFISAERSSFLAWGPPVPKARPRLGKQGKFYTPKNTLIFENHIAWVIHQQGIRYGDHPVRIYAEFHMGNDHLVDGDNLLKALLDGCVKGALFDDDSQVREFQCVVFYSSDKPRTEWSCERLDVSLLQSRYDTDTARHGELQAQRAGEAANVHDHGSGLQDRAVDRKDAGIKQ